MKKVLIIGIIGLAIIIGIFVTWLPTSFPNIQNHDNTIEGDSEPEPKPQGRDLSIELDEKMGFSAP